MLKKANSIILAGTMLALIYSCNDQSTSQQNQDPAVPRANARAALVQDTLTVLVKVPQGYHAYLDSGPSGNLLPIEFNWQQAIQAGVLSAAPQSTAAPQGEKESTSGAMVLRGEGRYSFSGVPAGLQGKQIGIRVQLCDDTLGICYKPTSSQLTVEQGPLL